MVNVELTGWFALHVNGHWVPAADTTLAWNAAASLSKPTIVLSRACDMQ